MTRSTLGGLTIRVVEPPGLAQDAVTCVLLHGFGAPGDDLVPLAEAIAAPVRFVFPEATLELGGVYGDARAWWQLDIARLEDEMRRGIPRNRRVEVPGELPSARTHVMRLLDELKQRHAIGDDRLVIGGFSQGAMLALDVALHRQVPPAGVILMSGTLIAEAEWQPRMATLAGVPVVLSHGRYDELLPFDAAEAIRDLLTAAGAAVDWHPFPGGHEIPPIVIDAAGALLRGVG